MLQHCARRLTTGAKSVSDAPRPKKSRLLSKLAQAYNAVPTGAREFGIFMPMFAAVFGVMMFMDVPGALKQRMTGAATLQDGRPLDMLSYKLEPLYDNSGKIFAYRRVSLRKGDGDL